MKQGELRIEYMPLGKLREMPGNPKLHQLEALGHSAKKYGFNDPPAIDETTGCLIEGHGRREWLLKEKASGEGPPEHIKVDPKTGEWLVPVVRGISFESTEEAEEYLLAHNEIGTAGGYHTPRLTEMLKRMDERKVNLTLLGFKKNVVKLLRDRKPLMSQDGPEPRYMVMVECQDEATQTQLLKRLMGDGYDCKAMLS